ncbi:beta/gamma crystallin-related protein [Streptomyces sp. NBRC 110028]|uniref:beta/gamma crystallin-related protein n=1 Tax=Streptomyces sp. NBRC 110028 TaxID=1621260 RepID=UPI0006E23772|nr:beta/gamma crystallin-related protein [Streptomyces sp. NBRC 110028]
MKTMTALLVAAAATTAILTTAPAAQADAAAGHLLLGRDQNLTGTVWAHSSSIANLGSSEGDKASSAKNEDSRAWVLYDDKNYKDRRYCLTPGRYIRDLHSDPWNFGDKVSSVRRLGTASCAGYPTF